MCDSASVTFIASMPAAPAPRSPGGEPGAESIEDRLGEELGRGVAAGELRDLVEVAEVQRPEHLVQDDPGAPDVDDDAVGIQRPPPELHVDDVGGAVQPLGRAEHLTGEAVGDHEVVADGHAEHVRGHSRVAPGAAS